MSGHPLIELAIRAGATVEIDRAANGGYAAFCSLPILVEPSRERMGVLKSGTTVAQAMQNLEDALERCEPEVKRILEVGRNAR